MRAALTFGTTNCTAGTPSIGLPTMTAAAAHFLAAASRLASVTKATSAAPAVASG
jgi:hypothetical protein